MFAQKADYTCDVAVGTESRLNGDANADQYDVSLAADGHNGFVATWTGGELTVLALEQQVVLHFSIASVGTYLFARSTHAGRAGAALAAIAFAFAGYATSFPVQQIIILQTGVWLPWILLGLNLTIGCGSHCSDC